MKRGRALRADTALSPAGRPGDEVYVGGLPMCCLRSFKAAATTSTDGRLAALECGCGRSWRVSSSLDERVLQSFVVGGGVGVGGGPSAA